jgi:hypothetical protein
MEPKKCANVETTIGINFLQERHEEVKNRSHQRNIFGLWHIASSAINDLLGFVAPVFHERNFFFAKTKKLGWDDPVPDHEIIIKEMHMRTYRCRKLIMLVG